MPQNWAFLKRFVQSPASIGSLMPSSRFLVAAMVAGIDWPRTASIAELGAGTGVITAAIESRRHADSRFLCFESDPAMRQALQRQYPRAECLDDAFALAESLREQGLAGLDCLVSGLPFANFAPARQQALLESIHQSLNPGGIFVAFQYTRQLQPYLVSFYQQYDSQRVWANLPPAFVYACRKSSLTGRA